MEKQNKKNANKEFAKKSLQYTLITFVIILICEVITNFGVEGERNTFNLLQILYLLLISYLLGILIASGRFVVIRYKDIFSQIRSSSNIIEDNNIVQTRSLTLPYNYEMSFYICMESISFLKHAYIKKIDLKEGIIKVRVGMSWKSFGENITFQVKPLNSEGSTQTLVKIESRPAMPGAFYDYGKNRENVQTITHFLNVICKIYLNTLK